MPGNFQTRCENCGHTSATFPENYMALELDEPTGLDSSNPHPDNPADCIIPIDGRAVFLEAHGFTLKSAIRSGRLLKYTRYFCRECGSAFDHRRYHISGLQLIGVFWPLVCSLVVAIVYGVLTSKWPVAIAVFTVSILLFSAVLGGFAEMRLSKALKEQKDQNRDVPRCPDCASIETTNHRIKCEACGMRKAKVVSAGKSKS